MYLGSGAMGKIRRRQLAYRTPHVSWRDAPYGDWSYSGFARPMAITGCDLAPYILQNLGPDPRRSP